jgi:tRNA(Ile)-lysidine synthase
MSQNRSLPERFRDAVRRARLFPRHGTAIVAVSGGPDSVALLDLLHRLAPELGLSLVVAHVDHGIMPAAPSVGRTVRKLAEQYGLPFETVELNLGPDTTETKARRARYVWLREVQRRHGAHYLVTAHHRDDQIETVLLRVLRGSAPAGLSGIAARARGGLLRPLLPFTHRELLEYVVAQGLTTHDDPANRDPRHLRSWIRVELLPRLVERLSPRVLDDLRDLRLHAARDRHAWNRVLDIVPLELDVGEGSFTVARPLLLGYDNALSLALLRAAGRRVGYAIGPKRARRILALATRPSGRRISLGGGWLAEVTFDRLRVAREIEIGCALERVFPAGEQGKARFGTFEIAWSPAAAPAHIERATWTTWVDSAGWELRPPAPGDSVAPLGGVGHRPLRRLLMEARVPRSARPQYPVVARGETILWVPGICRSADGVPAPGTRAVRLDVREYDSP